MTHTDIQARTHEREFLKGLKALMEEHNVRIQWDCGFGSDTHGIYEEQLQFVNDSTRNVFFVVEGNEVDKGDLSNY